MLGPGRSMMMDACDDSHVDLWNCIFALFLNFGWILAATIGMINVERIAPSNDDSPSIIRKTQVSLAIEGVRAILCVIGACTYRVFKDVEGSLRCNVMTEDGDVVDVVASGRSTR